MRSEAHPLKQLFETKTVRQTRRHDHSIEIPHTHINCRRHFYAVRVCFTWNALPSDIVNAPSLDIFKFKLDTYMLSNEIHEPVS